MSTSTVGVTCRVSWWHWQVVRSETLPLAFAGTLGDAVGFASLDAKQQPAQEEAVQVETIPEVATDDWQSPVYSLIVVNVLVFVIMNLLHPLPAGWLQLGLGKSFNWWQVVTSGFVTSGAPHAQPRMPQSQATPSTKCNTPGTSVASTPSTVRRKLATPASRPFLLHPLFCAHYVCSPTSPCPLLMPLTFTVSAVHSSFAPQHFRTLCPPISMLCPNRAGPSCRDHVLHLHLWPPSGEGTRGNRPVDLIPGGGHWWVGTRLMAHSPH